MAGPNDAIELVDDPSSRQAEADPADGAEEWFSAKELQRDSAVELDAGSEAPTLGRVPSAMACMEAWGRPELAADHAILPVPLLIGRTLWVTSNPMSVGIDWAESLVDELVRAQGTRVLYVSSEDPTEIEARAWARCVGQPRMRLRGSAAPEAVREDEWRARREGRRDRIRYFRGDALLESSDRVVEVAEALRSWRRAEGPSPTLVVVEHPDATLEGAPRDRVARLAREQEVAVIVTGTSFALNPEDGESWVRLTHPFRADESAAMTWHAPVAGAYGEMDLIWNPRTGRLRPDLPES